MTPTAQAIENAVLAVLAGTPPPTAAAAIGTSLTDLTEAVALYRAAGHAAILTAEHERTSWYQVSVEFPSHDWAERIAVAHLWPRLRQALHEANNPPWWFIRKAPCWRFRFHTTRAHSRHTIDQALDHLTAGKLITGWRTGIYEPETAAFGGTTGINTAHHIFHADSGGVLDYLTRDQTSPSRSPAAMPGRRELSILLCCTLMRAAGQEWHEQGDIWHSVTSLRPLPNGVPMDRLHAMTDNLQRLMTLDTHPAGTPFQPGGPLAFAAPWFTAIADAGHQLRQAAHAGTLHRGPRDILAHHVIFHWNRLGLPDTTQAILAHAAREAILGPHHPDTPSLRAAGP